jgi:hypothetical protein
MTETGREVIDHFVTTVSGDHIEDIEKAAESSDIIAGHLREAAERDLDLIEVLRVYVPVLIAGCRKAVRHKDIARGVMTGAIRAMDRQERDPGELASSAAAVIVITALDRGLDLREISRETLHGARIGFEERDQNSPPLMNRVKTALIEAASGWNSGKKTEIKQGITEFEEKEGS